MNDKIKELAIEAKLIASEPNGFDQNNLSKAQQKFAELIIRECARTAAMFSMNKNDIHPDIKWVDMTESAKLVNHTTCQQVAEKIKEHFGVEE